MSDVTVGKLPITPPVNVSLSQSLGSFVSGPLLLNRVLWIFHQRSLLQPLVVEPVEYGAIE